MFLFLFFFVFTRKKNCVKADEIKRASVHNHIHMQTEVRFLDFEEKCWIWKKENTKIVVYTASFYTLFHLIVPLHHHTLAYRNTCTMISRIPYATRANVCDWIQKNTHTLSKRIIFDIAEWNTREKQATELLRFSFARAFICI